MNSGMGAERLITVVHIVAGTIVLIVAPAAMLARKGGGWHRRSGMAFAAAMVLVIATAGVMWIPRGHLFLLFLDVLSAYLLFAGLRVFRRRRRRRRDRGADWLDLAAAAAVLLCALALVALAATASTSLMRGLALVLVALAVIGAAFAALDIKAIATGTQSRLGSLLMHLSAMIGAYISAVTAFCVINVHTAPMMLRWFVPSAVGTLVIGAFSLAYRRRFSLDNTDSKAIRKLASEVAANQ